MLAPPGVDVLTPLQRSRSRQGRAVAQISALPTQIGQLYSAF